MAMLPHERSLVERLQNKPFVLLGVSHDPSRAAMKRAQEEHDIPWRSGWDSGGKISAQYGVSGYPSLFLINPDGVIRKSYVGRPRDADLERDVMQVLREAEAAPGKASRASRTNRHDET